METEVRIAPVHSRLTHCKITVMQGGQGHVTTVEKSIYITQYPKRMIL